MKKLKFKPLLLLSIFHPTILEIPLILCSRSKDRGRPRGLFGCLINPRYLIPILHPCIECIPCHQKLFCEFYHLVSCFRNEPQSHRMLFIIHQVFSSYHWRSFRRQTRIEVGRIDPRGGSWLAPMGCTVCTQLSMPSNSGMAPPSRRRFRVLCHTQRSL